MKIKEGMLVKVVRIVGEDEDLLEYIGKIGVVFGRVYAFNFDEEEDLEEIRVYFGKGEYAIFYEGELKIINIKEQNNMFKDNCIWCYENNKTIMVSNKNFNIIMYYCPKCLR